MEKINKPRYYLSYSQMVPLQAVRLPAVDSIILTKMEDKWCNETKLKGYFNNKTKSGARSVRSIEIKGRGQAVVSFSETQGKTCKPAHYFSGERHASQSIIHGEH